MKDNIVWDVATANVSRDHILPFFVYRVKLPESHIPVVLKEIDYLTCALLCHCVHTGA